MRLRHRAPFAAAVALAAVAILPAAASAQEVDRCCRVVGGNDSAGGVLPYVRQETVYTAALAPEPGVVTSGSGSALLRLSADGLSAQLVVRFSNLSSPELSSHVHGPAGPGETGSILYDLGTATSRPDGTFSWAFVPVGPVSVGQIADAIRTGRTYFLVQTSQYAAGELRGQFRAATGGSTFVPPPRRLPPRRRRATTRRPPAS